MQLYPLRSKPLDGVDRAGAWIGALSVPAVAIAGYFRRKGLHYKLEKLEEKMDKRFFELQNAIIKGK